MRAFSLGDIHGQLMLDPVKKKHDLEERVCVCTCHHQQGRKRFPSVCGGLRIQAVLVVSLEEANSTVTLFPSTDNPSLIR